eukprot:403344433
MKKEEEQERQKNFIKKVASKVGFSIRDLALTKQKEQEIKKAKNNGESSESECDSENIQEKDFQDLKGKIIDEKKFQRFQARKQRLLKEKIKYFYRPYKVPVHHEHYMNFSRDQEGNELNLITKQKLKKPNNQAYEQFYQLVLNNEKQEIEEILSYIRHNQEFHDKEPDSNKMEDLSDSSMKSKKLIDKPKTFFKLNYINKTGGRNMSAISRTLTSNRSGLNSQADENSPSGRKKKAIRDHAEQQLKALLEEQQQNVLHQQNLHHQKIFRQPPPKSARLVTNMYFSDLDYQQLDVSIQSYQSLSQDSYDPTIPSLPQEAPKDPEPKKPLFQRGKINQGQILNMIHEMKNEQIEEKNDNSKLTKFIDRVVTERNQRKNTKILTNTTQLQHEQQDKMRKNLPDTMRQLKLDEQSHQFMVKKQRPQTSLTSRNTNHTIYKTDIGFFKDKIVEPQINQAIEDGNKQSRLKFSIWKQRFSSISFQINISISQRFIVYYKFKYEKIDFSNKHQSTLLQLIFSWDYLIQIQNKRNIKTVIID